MGFLKNLIRNAVSDGISKGIRDAVSSATEKAVAPKAEEYANKVADTLDEATKNLEAAANDFEAAAADLEKAKEELGNQAGLTENFLREWNEKVPDFPIWCFGGKNFSLSENGTTSDGYTYYLFDADDATEDGLRAYTALLKSEGFSSQHGDGDQIFYKDLGGEYLVFSKAEAFNAAPHMTIGLWRTKDTSEFMY